MENIGSLRNVKCKCGEKLGLHSASACDFYALVNYKHYKTFLKAEMKVIQCYEEDDKLNAIATSSQYVGVLIKCQRCSRIILFDADEQTSDGPNYYAKE